MVLGTMAVLAIVAGCNRGDNHGEASDSIVGTPASDTTLERSLDVTVTGDRAVAIHGRVKMRFLVRPGKGDDAAFSVASVTLPEPHRTADGWFVLPEIALVGMYDGDGTFTIPAGIGPLPSTGPTVPDATGESSVKVSVAQVTTFRREPTPEETRFGYLLEPCRVTLDKGATVGNATCPALIGYDGKRVSLTMAWKP